MPSREERVARQSFRSSVIIAVGNIFSMIFLFIGSVIIIRLLPASEYGQYSLALALPLFIQNLVGFGVRNAINRFSAYYLARGEIASARRMTKNATLFMIMTSLILTGISIVFSGVMAAYLLNRDVTTLYVEVASLLIFGQGMFVFLTPAFVGWREPTQDAIWTVVQAVLKMAISVALILLGLGVIGALFGYVFASLIAGSGGIVAFYFLKLRNRAPEPPTEKWSFKTFAGDIREMNHYGFNAYIGNIIRVLSQQPIMTIILAFIATKSVIGYFSAAGNITQSITTISAALTAAFITAFASLDGMGSDIGLAFKHATKYVSYFMTPLVLFMFSSSGLIVQIFYSKAYSSTGYYLEVLSLAYVPYALGYSVLIPYFNGTDNTKIVMLMNIIEALATVIPVVVLVYGLKLGINGVLLTIIISNIAPTVFGLYVADKYMHARADYSNLFKALFVGILGSALLFLLSVYVLRNISVYLDFAIELFVFLAVYLTLLPITRTITKEDVDRLRVASHGIRGLDKLLAVVLDYESFLIALIKRKQE